MHRARILHLRRVYIAPGVVPELIPSQGGQWLCCCQCWATFSSRYLRSGLVSKNLSERDPEWPTVLSQFQNWTGKRQITKGKVLTATQNVFFLSKPAVHFSNPLPSHKIYIYIIFLGVIHIFIHFISSKYYPTEYKLCD